ncbi:MAG: TlpA family protein disulfide reductase [Bacteroidales bacterium]|nr:TlpA family protein disulfide reductase [Bacteroidales bacterium]
MTKRTHIRIIPVLLALVFGTAGMVCAQVDEPCGCMTSVRNLIHYNIQIIDKGIISNHKVLYLEGYQCGTPVYLDSAVVKGGKAKFKSKHPVEKGVYHLVYEKGGAPVWDIMLRNSHNSLMTYGNGYNKVGNFACKSGSYEVNYANLSDEIRRDSRAIVSVDAFRQIIEKYSDAPGSSVEQYYLYDVALSAYLSVLQQNPQLSIPKSIYDYVISKLNLSDPLIWNSKSAIHPFISKYLTDNQIYDTEYLIPAIDSLLAGCCRPGFLATYLFNAYWASGEPAYDPILLHLYDKYNLPCCLGDRARVAKRKMDVVRKLAPGAQIPELTAYDIDGKQHSTNEIQTKYTILWFWDPDCDHCQEQTPILHDLYQEKADELDFEVFAVEVNDDYDRWTAFSEKHGLDDWINLSTSMGETSEDFIEYFDIVTTPVILLIDNEKNHVIIARQITLDEVVRLMR